MKRSFLFCLALGPLLLAAQTSMQKGKDLFSKKSYDLAIKEWQLIKENQNDYADAQYWIGRAYFEKREFAEASEFFENAIEKTNNNAEYHFWLGNSLGSEAQTANLLRQGMLAPKMKTAWEKAIELDKNHVEARASLIQYYLQAPSFMGGSVSQAKAIAHEIVKLNKPVGYRELAEISLYEKNKNEAEIYYKKMFEADRNFRIWLGNFYITEKRYEQAFDLYEGELKKDPNDLQAIYQVGKISAISGQRLDRGASCLLIYLKSTPKSNEPSHAAANMRLAQVREKEGKKQEALALFTQAYTTDKTLSEAKEGMERLKK